MHHTINKKIKIILYIFLVLFLTSINNLNFNKLKKNFFLVDKIKINGLNETLAEEIKLKLEPYLENNLFLLNKKKMQSDLNVFPFIENYSIFKKYPSEMIVNIKETKLIAKTFINSSTKYIGSNGKIIEENYYKPSNSLPQVFGKFRPHQLLEIFLLLETNNFMLQEISEVYYFDSRRWDIKFKNNILIRLPSVKIGDSIHIAKKFIEKEKINGNIIIDLRVANRVIISND